MAKGSRRLYLQRKFKLWAIISAIIVGPTIGCGALSGIAGAIPGSGLFGQLLGGPLGGLAGFGGLGGSPQLTALADLLKPPSTPIEGEFNAPLLPTAENKIIVDGALPSPINLSPVTTLDDTPSHAAVGPDGRIYYTEKHTGRVRVFDIFTSQVDPTPVLDVAVNSSGRRGLIGITFPLDGSRMILTYNASTTGADSNTEPEALDARLVSYPFSNGAIVGPETVMWSTTARDSAFPSDLNGIGPCIIGPGGDLYVGHGDRNSRLTALNFEANEPSGKILRFGSDGSLPMDNPKPQNPLFAAGFRNPVSMTFDSKTGALFATDVGSGTSDEINVVVGGLTYGWPLIYGSANTEWEQSLSTLLFFAGKNPLIDYGYGKIEPRGLIIYRGGVYPGLDGDIFVGQGNQIPGIIHRYHYPEDFLNLIVDHTVVATVPEEAGKIQDMITGPEGRIYVFCTSQLFVLDAGEAAPAQ